MKSYQFGKRVATVWASWSRGEQVGFVLLCVVAFGVRLGWVGLTEFKADEARLMWLSLEMADGQTFPLRGISSSVGVANFPMSVWIYALPLFFWEHPYAPTLFTGLVNGLAVLGCYGLVRRYWGWQAGLLAAFLLATSPWAIHHSRKIWAQNLLLPMTMGWGICVALGVLEKRRWWQAGMLVCVALAVQVHFAGAALGLATVGVMGLFWRRLDMKGMGLGLFFGGLTAVPFLTYMAQNQITLQSVLSGAGSGEARAWSGRVFELARMLISGQNIHALVGGEQFQTYQAHVSPILRGGQWVAEWAWLGVMVFGVGWLIWRWRGLETQQKEITAVCLLWFMAPLLLFGLPLLPLELHYLLPLYPVPYMVAGIWLAQVGWKRAVWVGVMVTCAFQLWAWGSVLGFVATTQTVGGFGTPLQMQLTAVEQTLTLQEEVGAQEVLIAGRGDDPRVDDHPAIYKTLFWEQSVRFVDSVGGTAVFPAHRTILFLPLEDVPATQTYVTHLANQSIVPLREGETDIVVGWLDGIPSPEQVLPQPARLQNGVQIMGGKWQEGAWQLWWQAGVPSNETVQLFNHLLDDSGGRVAQVDGAVFPARQWQTGDMTVSHFSFPQETTGTQMRVGMYTYPEFAGIYVLDEAGNPYTDGVLIPLGGDS